MRFQHNYARTKNIPKYCPFWQQVDWIHAHVLPTHMFVFNLLRLPIQLIAFYN
jgi:hypothetical protein